MPKNKGRKNESKEKFTDRADCDNDVRHDGVRLQTREYINRED